MRARSTVGQCICLLSSRKFNLSHCSGCAYEFRAILGLLQSCSKGILSFETSKPTRLSVLPFPTDVDSC